MQFSKKSIPVTSIQIILLILSTSGRPVFSGFADPIESHNMDSMITQVRTPRISDNTSLVATSKKEDRQAFYPTHYNPASHFSSLANMANLGGFGSLASMGGLRTVMMGGMLYGLSLIPAVVLALGGNGLPMSGVLSSLGLSKRALPETSSAKMPLLSESQTRRLLQMLQSAFRQWNIADVNCKELFVCQMYRQVSSNGVTPDLDLFKEALLHILERGGQRRAGRAAEHLLAEYEHYFAAARMGMEQDECETFYPKCNLSLYPKDDGFKKEKETKPSKKSTTKDQGKDTNTKETSLKNGSN
ncbi:uncharacterized protein LOC129234359 [Uloborus diversus]|uniref:uncharacterized protein LOC129234359 n=1 Tax=Uloborus diversus TaxID=327109 RepID=UPI00240A5324|nr:uncharacterized protein LOC129234359 [Uloborus diversus]